MQVTAVARAAGVQSREAKEKAEALARLEAGLSMYSDPPNEKVTLEDFEVLAFERLKLLKAIETEKSRGTKPRDLASKISETITETLGRPSVRGRESARRFC